MKIKCLLYFICAIFLSNVSYSQNIFGIKAGVQLSKITGVEGNPEGFLASPQVEGVGIFKLGEAIAITPSVGYSGKGYQWNNLQFTDQYGNPLGEGDMIGRFHYVQISVPISYTIPTNPNKEFYFGVGPYLAYAFSAKGRLKHVAIAGGEESWDLFENDLYKKADAGLVVEIASRINRKYLIAFNLDIGLSNINNGGGNKFKQLAAGLSVGYLFNRRS